MKSKKLIGVGIVLVILLSCSICWSAPADLSLGSAEGRPGSTVQIPFTLSNGKGIVAVSADIAYDTSVLTNPRAEAGPAAISAEKEVYSSTPSEGVFRVGLLGMNLKQIPDGEIVTVLFDIKSGEHTNKKKTKLDPTTSASDAKGGAVPVKGSKGVITIK